MGEKRYPWLICLAAAAVSPAFARPAECGMPDISRASALGHFLILRAVDVVKRAGGPDEGLAALVAPDANFSLGGGDVGRPLGTGLNGARALARAMRADAYRFFGWNYMDMPADPCSRQKVEIEFIDNQGKHVSRVEFTFEAGRVVGAEGWQRSFETGRL